MFKSILFLGFVILFSSCKDEFVIQSSRYRLSSTDYTSEFHYKDYSQIKKFDPDVTYYWSDRSQIFTTQGAASGLVLDGAFTKYYATGEILEKGEYMDGMKVGEWRKWEKSGRTIEVEYYRKGRLHGDATNIIGDTVVVSEYKKGLKDGVEVWSVNGKKVKSITYHSGLEKKRKEKSAKQLKKDEKRDRRKDVPTTQTSDTTEVKGSFFRRIFSKAEESKADE